VRCGDVPAESAILTQPLCRVQAGELVPFGFPPGGEDSPAEPAEPPAEPSTLRRRHAPSPSPAPAAPSAVVLRSPRPPGSLAHLLASSDLSWLAASVPGGPGWGYLSRAARPHILLWCLLAVPCLLVMHVQVSTRLLASACPALYWYCAHLTGTQPAVAGRLVWGWSLLYAAAGTVLFVNFDPWT